MSNTCLRCLDLESSLHKYLQILRDVAGSAVYSVVTEKLYSLQVQENLSLLKEILKNDEILLLSTDFNTLVVCECEEDSFPLITQQQQEIIQSLENNIENIGIVAAENISTIIEKVHMKSQNEIILANDHILSLQEENAKLLIENEQAKREAAKWEEYFKLSEQTNVKLNERLLIECDKHLDILNDTLSEIVNNQHKLKICEMERFIADVKEEATEKIAEMNSNSSNNLLLVHDTTETEQLRAEVSVLRERLADLDKEMTEETETEAGWLKSEIEELREDLTSAFQDRDELKEELELMSEELNNLKEEKEEQLEKMEELKETIEEMKEEMEEDARAAQELDVIREDHDEYLHDLLALVESNSAADISSGSVKEKLETKLQELVEKEVQLEHVIGQIISLDPAVTTKNTAVSLHNLLVSLIESSSATAAKEKSNARLTPIPEDKEDFWNIYKYKLINLFKYFYDIDLDDDWSETSVDTVYDDFLEKIEKLIKFYKSRSFNNSSQLSLNSVDSYQNNISNMVDSQICTHQSTDTSGNHDKEICTDSPRLNHVELDTSSLISIESKHISAKLMVHKDIDVQIGHGESSRPTSVGSFLNPYVDCSVATDLEAAPPSARQMADLSIQTDYDEILDEIIDFEVEIMTESLIVGHSIESNISYLEKEILNDQILLLNNAIQIYMTDVQVYENELCKVEDHLQDTLIELEELEDQVFDFIDSMNMMLGLEESEQGSCKNLYQLESAISNLYADYNLLQLKLELKNFEMLQLDWDLLQDNLDLSALMKGITKAISPYSGEIMISSTDVVLDCIEEIMTDLVQAVNENERLMAIEDYVEYLNDVYGLAPEDQPSSDVSLLEKYIENLRETVEVCGIEQQLKDLQVFCLQDEMAYQFIPMINLLEENLPRDESIETADDMVKSLVNLINSLRNHKLRASATESELNYLFVFASDVLLQPVNSIETLKKALIMRKGESILFRMKTDIDLTESIDQQVLLEMACEEYEKRMTDLENPLKWQYESIDELALRGERESTKVGHYLTIIGTNHSMFMAVLRILEAERHILSGDLAFFMNIFDPNRAQQYIEHAIKLQEKLSEKNIDGLSFNWLKNFVERVQTLIDRFHDFKSIHSIQSNGHKLPVKNYQSIKDILLISQTDQEIQQLNLLNALDSSLLAEQKAVRLDQDADDLCLLYNEKQNELNSLINIISIQSDCEILEKDLDFTIKSTQLINKLKKSPPTSNRESGYTLQLFQIMTALEKEDPKLQDVNYKKVVNYFSTLRERLEYAFIQLSVIVGENLQPSPSIFDDIGILVTKFTSVMRDYVDLRVEYKDCLSIVLRKKITDYHIGDLKLWLSTLSETDRFPQELIELKEYSTEQDQFISDLQDVISKLSIQKKELLDRVDDLTNNPPMITVDNCDCCKTAHRTQAIEIRTLKLEKKKLESKCKTLTQNVQDLQAETRIIKPSTDSANDNKALREEFKNILEEVRLRYSQIIQHEIREKNQCIAQLNAIKLQERLAVNSKSHQLSH